MYELDNHTATAQADINKKTSNKKRWVWSSEMVETLLKFLLEYKNAMVYEGVDKNGKTLRLFWTNIDAQS